MKLFAINLHRSKVKNKKMLINKNLRKTKNILGLGNNFQLFNSNIYLWFYNSATDQ